jgi:hypothetical protein
MLTLGNSSLDVPLQVQTTVSGVVALLKITKIKKHDTLYCSHWKPFP